MRRALRWGGLALLALAALLAAVLIVVDTPAGHRWVAVRIGEVKLDNGLRFTVGGIDGSLYGRATLRDVRVHDPEGLVFVAPVARLAWHPLRWFANMLDIDALDIPAATFAKVPRTRPTGRQGPILPGFDIRIGRLTVDTLTIAPPVAGASRTGRIVARADIRSGRALVNLAARVDGSDRLRLRLDAEPDRDRFDLSVAARGTSSGVLARLTGIGRPLSLDVDGDGTWRRWRGRAEGRVSSARLLSLRLAADSARYTLAGTVAPALVTRGKVQRLTAPQVLVNGSGTFEARRLDGTLSLRSAALAIDGTGIVDLGTGAYRNVRIAARLLRPAALFRNMSGREIGLRAILDGPFATARFDYRLSATRFAFDRTGFEEARAAGRGRLSGSPVLLPVRFTARRVTGVGEVAGGILGNLSVEGVLQVTPRLVTGEGLRLRSDRLSGRIRLWLDLRSGRYDIGLEGALGRYLIPGLGLVDVRSTLTVAPGPGGRGTRIVGRGTAQMLRLDNAFFRSIAGGLPRIETGLERTADGILHFNRLILVAPALRLTGNGYRRRDGTFFFEGSGQQARYGPIGLRLDGRIEKPVIDVTLQRPNAALGLSGVRAHLDPTAEGFGFRAAGGSRLGPFAATGRILLPRGAEAAIAVDRLDVAGTQARGMVALAPGGFDGRLSVAGGGLSGTIGLQPVDAVQRIDLALAAAGAELAGTRISAGRLTGSILLDPAGAVVDVRARATGLRRGALRIHELEGAAKLRGGAGAVTATVSGTRGRAFVIGLAADVSADAIRVSASGTIDRRPIALTEPAVLRQAADGWHLDRARVRFAGGSADISGRFGATTALQATLSQLPLTVLDIGYPGLGLGGAASGTVSLTAGGGGRPSGRADLTVRGLTRSGLVRTSQPIDLAIAGLLTGDRAAARVVAASAGKTVGRGQVMLGGDLTDPAATRLFGQLRYQGPADTLWRLTGIELFELSGPVAVGADVTGTVARPQLRGVLRAQGARIESATTGTVLSDVAADGRFAGSRLEIARLSAKAGSGRVTGSGAFDFAGAAGVGIDLRIEADRAVLIDRDDIAATVTGPLTFRSGGRGGVIGGDVRLDRSRYRLGQASAVAAAPRLRVREINAAGADDVADVPTAPWTLDIHARAPGQLSVTGLGLTSEWSADLRIGGEPTNPAITGRARLIRGNYEFAGREFQLSRGAIRFGGEVPANPALDIEADADVPGLNASIRVTGVAQKPEITFASTPALPQDELLSRLLFGTSITNLSAPEALQLAAAVAALQDGGTGLNPINAVRRAAGLDRLRILPADAQTGQGTSIAAGKYVTRRLYAEIVTDGQGYSATRVEYLVTRWLSVLSSISTLGRTSANVRVSKDY